MDKVRTESTNHNLFERKESRRGIEPRSFRLPRFTARPNRLTTHCEGMDLYIYIGP